MDQAADSAVTIVGGGIIGCAVAYVMARAGYGDIQVLERSQLCGETSSKAAGLVGQVRTTLERTRIAMESVAMFSSLEHETGVTPDWVQSGSLRLALTADRALEFERMAHVAALAGLEVETISTQEVVSMIPLKHPEKIVSTLWCPSDGYLQPNSLAMSYVAGARALGVRFVTGCEVRGIGVRAGAVDSVTTTDGRYKTELVVNAAGPWANWVTRMIGLELPIVPVRHEYFITGAMELFGDSSPVLRIPDERIYVRGELDGVLCGGWEAQALSIHPDRVDDRLESSPGVDWDTIGGFAQSLSTFAPAVLDAGVRGVVGGFPGFTPDGRFIVGPVPGAHGFIMAAGCNAHGVSGSAGIAALVLESLSDDPSGYVRSLSPGRFMGETDGMDQLRLSAQRVYESYYAIDETSVGRGDVPRENLNPEQWWE